MNKEQFVALGLSDELAEKAATASADELKGFVPKARFDEVNEAKKQAEKGNADRDKQLEELKKSTGDSAALQEQITKLQDENKAATEKYDADLKELRLNTAIKLALAGDAHDPDIVAGLLDKSKIELDDSGAVKGGLDDLLKPLRESKGFLFAEKQEEPGNKFKGASPKDGTDKKAGGPPDFTLMSDEEYYRYKESQDSKK
ncbi:phage scaffolding protein [Paenibacillus graminis]|uniref:phage scaffolding protein n=1 Tax=Paenibacillus graminis TaxID=189425 RepID=UPI002DBDBC2B|nr:phage scaffolding protein [Paenibacillus graminis]MEC0171662.1 phage scaffolding protein [Paenibacillus graminis]